MPAPIILYLGLGGLVAWAIGSSKTPKSQPIYQPPKPTKPTKLPPLPSTPTTKPTIKPTIINMIEDGIKAKTARIILARSAALQPVVKYLNNHRPLPEFISVALTPKNVTTVHVHKEYPMENIRNGEKMGYGLVVFKTSGKKLVNTPVYVTNTLGTLG